MATIVTKGNSFLSAFIDQCKQLARTVTIRSNVSALTLNEFLKLKYGGDTVDDNAPSTWKYYMNISGEYHPLDTMMTVTSLDTQTEIEFTKENLANHVATKEAYGFGTRYYYSLVNTYPEQEQLIMGILYPVDKAFAISSDEGTILGYPKELVEDQEQTLILDLEQWIKGYLHRWNVSAYAVTDSLYNTSYHAGLYIQLALKIVNLRTRRIHTAEAHSFHVRSYLASHNYLNQYLPYLTLKQSLYLYRNVRYLMRNAGSTKTFNELLQNVLTDRHIPMAEYSVRQLNTFDSNYYPEITARRKPINRQVNSGEISFITMDNFYGKEEALVYGNPSYFVAKKDSVNLSFQNSDSSVTQLKALESNMVDYNDAVPDPLVDVLMRQWVYMATHNLYNVTINFKDPNSGEVRSLYALDALIYHQYIFYKSIGYDLKVIPQIYNRKARNNPKPTLEKLLSVADPKFKDFPVIAQDILNGQPMLNACVSVKGFYDQSYKIYEEAQRHWFMLSDESDLERRGYLEGMILQLYHDELITLDVGVTTISDWLAKVNMPEYNYTVEQAKELVSNIFLAATGLVIDNTKSLPNIQRNLISLFMDLSSYTIQTIREINDSSIVPLNWPAVRIGNIKTHSDSTHWVETNGRVGSVSASVSNKYTIDASAGSVVSVVQDDGVGTIVVDNTTVVVMDAETVVNFTIPSNNIDISYSYDGYDPQVQANDGYIGKEFYLSLSDAQKQAIKNNPLL